MNTFGGAPPVGSISGRSFTPGRGFTTVVRYTGTAQSIGWLESIFAARKQKYVANYDNPALSYLEATLGEPLDGSPAASQIESVWNLRGKIASIDVWDVPVIKAWTDSLYALALGDPPDYANGLNALATLKKNITDSFAAGVANAQTAAWFAASADFRGLYDRLARGLSSVEHDVPTLTNLKTYPAGYVIAPDYTNVNRIATTAQIVAANSDLTFTLPADWNWLTRFFDIEQRSDGKLTQLRTWEAFEGTQWPYLSVT